MLSQERLLIAAKHGEGIYKALAGLKKGEFDGVVDVLKDQGKDWLAEKIRDKQLEFKVKSIQAESLRELEENLKGDLDEDRFDYIYRTAISTFNVGHTFDALFDAHTDIDRAAKAWPGRAPQPFGLSDEEADQLHDTILRATIAAFIRHIKDLKGYDAWFLGRVRLMKGDIDDLKLFVEHHRGEEARKDFEYELEYLKEARTSLDVVELFIKKPGIDEESTEQELSVAYVSLRLSTNKGKNHIINDVPAGAILDRFASDQRRVLVVGRAGSGKTTLLRWYGLEASNALGGWDCPDDSAEQERTPQDVASQPAPWRNAVPFFIRLRRYKDGELPSPDDFHHAIFKDRKPPLGWAERIVHSGRAMFLIDGLDELSSHARSKAIKEIRRWVDRYPAETIYFVTSRAEAVPDNVLVSQGFTTFNVMDLSVDNRDTFIDRWHEAVFRRLGSRSTDRASLDAKRDRLKRELRNNGGLARLAVNPLLAALICALNRYYPSPPLDSNGKERPALPDNQVDLCESAVKMLLIDRDELGDIAHKDHFPSYQTLHYEARKDVAARLACDLLKSGVDTVSEATALDIVRLTCRLSNQESNHVAQEILDGIRLRAGLLRHVGDDELEFVHNLMRDYLASLVIVDNRDKSIIVQKIRTDDVARWAPVALFCAATKLSSTFGIELLERLVEAARTTPKNSTRLKILAFAAARLVVYAKPPELEASLRAFEKEFVPVDTVAKANAIAEIGETGIEFLTHRSDMSPELAAACVAALNKIGTEEARTAILDYFADDSSATVLNALAEALGYALFAKHRNVLDIPSVLSAVTSSQSKNHPACPYITDLSPLAGMKKIKWLDLSGANVTDLSPLADASSLETLILNGTKVADVSPLSECISLRVLWLDEARIKDITPLLRLESLESLSLYGAVVSHRQVSALKKTLPRCLVLGQ